MKFVTKVKISAFLFIICKQLVLSDNEFLNKCPEFNPQNELDIELISGLWFGGELITHYEGRGGYIQASDICTFIQIEEIHEWGDYNYDYDDRNNHRSRHFDYNPDRYRFLELTWSEADKTAKYTLKFLSKKRGLWIGTEPPKGSIRRNHLLHSHYTGTIQVMKAVGNHLVLTFCEKSELFTIILTRTKNLMPIEDVESIHALLGRRGLAVQSVRELCRNNSAIRLTLHTAVVFTLMMIFLMGN